jgi:hypothetical protein
MMYWGNNDLVCSPLKNNVYDDNRHGAGTGNNPRNPLGTDSGTDKGFQTISFGASSLNRYAVRLEIDRVEATYQYKMRVWLISYASAVPDSNGVQFDDTSQKYNKNNDAPPSFQQTITLTQDWHDKFDRILFGWTQATGGSTQNITIPNFKIDFKNKNDF